MEANAARVSAPKNIISNTLLKPFTNNNCVPLSVTIAVLSTPSWNDNTVCVNAAAKVIEAIHAGIFGLLVILNLSPPSNHITLV